MPESSAETAAGVRPAARHAAMSNWAGLAYVSLFSMYLGFFAWFAGLNIGGVARVSQIQLLQPMLTIVWAALLLDEAIIRRRGHDSRTRARFRCRIKTSFNRPPSRIRSCD